MKIFHTADLHIGLKFTRDYDPDVRERLIQARFTTLQRMVSLANEQGCDLFVIAGDLFDNTRPAKKDILRVARILKDCEGSAVILPGNHDYVQPDQRGLWSDFSDAMGENTLLLLELKRYEIQFEDLKVAIYPGPCQSKHSSKNAVGWITEHKKKAAEIHIGIAHGSLEGVSPDFNEEYYPMTKAELESIGMDLWLMGHTHVRVPSKKRGKGWDIFFASTPEPDGFDCAHEGFAWLFTLQDSENISYRAVQTGEYQFLTLEEELKREEDVEALKERFQNLGLEKHLVKLKVYGRIPREIFDERSAIWEELEECVLHLEVDDFDLLQQITTKDINREFTKGSFPYELLMDLEKDKDNPLALQIAYDLICEVKS